MKSNSFTFASRINSFRFAFRGFMTFFRQEPNAVIHLIATIIVIIAGFIFPLSITEKALLAIVIAMVWIAEIFNTCIERSMDIISLQWDKRIERIKDMAAAAVFLAAMAAVFTGLIIFIPKILP